MNFTVILIALITLLYAKETIFEFVKQFLSHTKKLKKKCQKIVREIFSNNITSTFCSKSHILFSHVSKNLVVRNCYSRQLKPQFFNDPRWQLLLPTIHVFFSTLQICFSLKRRTNVFQLPTWATIAGHYLWFFLGQVQDNFVLKTELEFFNYLNGKHLLAVIHVFFFNQSFLHFYIFFKTLA